MAMKRNGSFQQLLRIKDKDDPNLAEWLWQKKNVYTSPVIQNEVIKVLSFQVLWNVSSESPRSLFLTLMADETTDRSNLEQAINSLD